MDMIVLAIVCGILANELFAWGPRLSDLLLKIALKRMPPKLQDRMREEWQAHLDTLPGGLSKLGAAASFLLSTFWGFRRYREDETPIEIEERIAVEAAFAWLLRQIDDAAATAEGKGAELAKILRRADENRTQLVKRRIHGRKPDPSLPPYRYKTALHNQSAPEIVKVGSGRDGSPGSFPFLCPVRGAHTQLTYSARFRLS
jgi:hypothetical protein